MGSGRHGNRRACRCGARPFPLVLPFVPLIALAHLPFAGIAVAMGIPSGLGELGIAGKAMFVAWSALLGAVAGQLLGAWRARRNRSAAE